MSKKTQQNKKLHVMIIVIGLITGMLSVWQFQSYDALTNTQRETNANNIFREVQVLKTTNDDLQNEINALTEELSKLTDGRSYREATITKLEKNKAITGLIEVTGSGITLKISDEISVAWLVDMQNELWSAGAEAIAINGIRLSPYSVGFENFGGQTYLNKIPLHSPYTIEAIGNNEILKKILTQQGSISARLIATYPKINITVNKSDLITIAPIQ